MRETCLQENEYLWRYMEGWEDDFVHDSYLFLSLPLVSRLSE